MVSASPKKAAGEQTFVGRVVRIIEHFEPTLHFHRLE
jgi:hypothetical protein